MKFERKISVSRWDDEAAGLAIQYLMQRGFMNARSDHDDQGPTVFGTRGSWLGNLISFDMTKLRAAINVRAVAPAVVAVELGVNTFGQQITEWNSATFRIELAELGHVLCGRGTFDAVWKDFLQAARAADINWSFSFGGSGQRLTSEWESRIRGLEQSVEKVDAGAA